MTYRELQAALKAFRTQGLDVQVKLNASFDTLQAEYDKLEAFSKNPNNKGLSPNDKWVKPEPNMNMGKLTSEQLEVLQGNSFCIMDNPRGNEPAAKQPSEQLEVTPDGAITLQLGGNIKEPTANLAITKDDQGNETATKQQSKPLETLSDKDITPQLRGNIQQTSKQLHNSPKALIQEGIGTLALVSSRVDFTYSNSLPQNEPYSAHENSQSFVEQGFEYIQSEPREQYLQTAFESPESLPRNTLAISPNDSPNSPYWIDGSELGQNLEYTQAQALRNLEDGLNWLLRLPGRLKAFEQGVREGLRNAQLKQQASLKQPHVIPIERWLRRRFAYVPPTNS